MPYPYTLMPDGHTLEPEEDEQAEESQSWLPSYIPPIVPPTPRPGLTSGESGGDGTSPPPLDVDPAVQEYERNLYQRLGITPPHESGEPTTGQSNPRPGAGASQTEDSRDNNQAKDEVSVHAVLPDIAEVQDDFGANRLVDNTRWDRLHRHSNLDVIRVQQNIERRPLIFQHCFQHSASNQDALECIYAFPPDFDEDELRYLEQIADQKAQELLVAMGGDSDDENGGDFTVPYGSLIRYEEHLESKYGFQIKWGEASDRTNMAEQLTNLDKAIGYILNYLAKEVYGDESLALEAFQQHFSQSKFGELEIHLGTESDPKDKGYGSVPLPYYKDGKLINADVEELRKMYLGSAVDIPTIVHEFGHVIDRSRGITDHLTDTIPPYRMSRIATASRDYGGELWGSYSFNLDATVHTKIIEGFVAKQYFVQEFWADLFMTAVLDPAVSDHTFYVRSIDDEMILRPVPKEGEKAVPEFPETKFYSDFDSRDPLSDRHFYKCSDEGITCVTKTIMWEDTTWAEAAQSILPTLVRERLPTEGEQR